MADDQEDRVDRLTLREWLGMAVITVAVFGTFAVGTLMYLTGWAWLSWPFIAGFALYVGVGRPWRMDD